MKIKTPLLCTQRFDLLPITPSGVGQPQIGQLARPESTAMNHPKLFRNFRCLTFWVHSPRMISPKEKKRLNHKIKLQLKLPRSHMANLFKTLHMRPKINMAVRGFDLASLRQGEQRFEHTHTPFVTRRNSPLKIKPIKGSSKQSNERMTYVDGVSRKRHACRLTGRF